MKPWWQSRTLWLNLAVLVLAAAEANVQMLQPLLPLNIWQVTAFVLPILNAVLRLVTTQALTLHKP